ncbi:MAG: M50 family metallopeptidase [Chloroflexota bacterium]
MFVDWQLFRRRALGMSLIALVIVFIVWNIPQLNAVLYPFRLFVTFVHESGHGLAAILSGGEFVRFEVMANGTGLATTRGGSRAAILPAGYLSAALFGAGLFFITNRVPYPRIIAVVLAAGLAALSLLFGQTSQIALTVGLAFAVALTLIGLFASRYVVVFMLNVLAIITALNAVLDLFFLTRNLDARTTEGRVLNDAAAFTLEIVPHTSVALWAWLWAVISIALLSYAVYRSLLKPLIEDAMLASRRARRQPIVREVDPEPVYYDDYTPEYED